MSETINAQVLYDLRDELAQISGSDLHELFRAMLDGEPSPAGRTLIDIDRLIDIMQTTDDRDLSQFIQDALTG